ncbi:uncharacterized protein LOC132563843 [Ylistrum balloti]|uniref:uncharacterized protein LOC132563843 n=1 Tax=Ylistrum balloti TaxID=509963 RepID=UPI002905CE3E|nr:uncharacterized protein LOC132563843 [Ylistrum balloti]
MSTTGSTLDATWSIIGSTLDDTGSTTGSTLYATVSTTRSTPDKDPSDTEDDDMKSSDEEMLSASDAENDTPDDADWIAPSDASEDNSLGEAENFESVIPPSVSEEDDTVTFKASESKSSEISLVAAKSNNNKVIIQQATLTNNRRSDKLRSCLYCCRMYARILRHYTQVHSKETDVAKVLALSKKSKARKSLWAKIVNKGDFNHNIDVMKNQQGMVIPKYRPRTNQDCMTKYVPCKYCLGMFVPTDLWKHARSCKSRDDPQKTKAGYREMVNSGKLLLPVVGSSHQLFENILTKMKNDAITRAVENDDLILLFGERLYNKNGHNFHQHQYISQRLRELVQFLIQVREMFPSFVVSSCLLPCNWDKLLKGLKQVAGYNEGTHVYDIALPLKLGHSFSKCAKILKMQAVREDNEVLKKTAEGFLELYESEWAESISSQALTTLHNSKFNKPQYVPLAADVKRLTIYLKKRADVLQESSDSKGLDDLVEVVLAQLILFNRKRSGETQRMEIKDYREGIKESGVALDEEVQMSLTKFERELCAVHYRIKIKGKRGRKVSVLISEDVKNSIDHMLSKRPKESKYLFMKTENTQPIRGCDLLRKFARACGAQHPQHLTSTRLRKHLATMSQILGLREEHKDMLAKFMGHDI